jgi:hypothetical protein
LRCTASEDGILAEGTSSVTLEAGSLPETSLNIDAGEHGILAEGTSSVTLAVGSESPPPRGSLNIDAGEHGIRATGNADVVVLNDPICMINGTEGPTRIDGNATIDGCGF